MPSTHFILFLCALTLTQALISPQADPTPRSHDLRGLLNGRSPKPTPAPKPRRLGAMVGDELFRRQEANINTCGWINGDPSAPIACDIGSVCGYQTEIPMGFGCCSAIGTMIIQSDCVYRDTCIQYGDSANPYSNEDYFVTDATLYCGLASPYCLTITNYDASSNTWYHEGCNDVGPTAYTAWMYTSSVNDASSPAVSSSVPVPTIPNNPGSSSPVNNKPTTISQTSSSVSGSGSATVPPTPHPTSSSNAGPIAGGVVGSILGIALIGGGIGYLIHRKKKQRVQPVPEISRSNVAY